MYCDMQNLEASSNTSAQISLPFGLLVEPDSEYYCRVDIEAQTQQERAAENYQASSANCTLTFDSLDSQSNVAISIDANLLSKFGIGDELVPNVDFITAKPGQIIGLNASIGADNSLKEQRFADICLSINANESICTSGFSFVSGVDNKFSEGFLNESLNINTGDQINFTCRTQQGRKGSCLMQAFLKLSEEDLANLSHGVIDRSSFYKLSPSSIEDYCESCVLNYTNEPEFVMFDTEEKKQERCKAVLSSAVF
jgi:hypothetical protein